MAEGSGGISAGEVHSIVSSAVNSVRNELIGEINSVRRELEREIDRLEREMKEVGQMIASEIRNQTSFLGGKIENQTVAVVGGVAANTIMLERTKSQLEADFEKTRTKLDLQTEATLQIEVGKKMADAMASNGKLMAFAKDIKNRFERSLEAFYLNRQLYNVNFKKIFEEYTNKLKTIGEHIFSVRDNDIGPAIEAAQVPLEEIHGLPVEVDLFRLKVRAENLDQALRILKDSRFDKVLHSINSLENKLDSQFGLKLTGVEAQLSSMAAVVLATESPISKDFLVGRDVQTIQNEQSINIGPSNPSLVALSSDRAQQLIANAKKRKETRELTPNEMGRLVKAAAGLAQRNLISKEAVTLFEDFIGSGNLKVVG